MKYFLILVNLNFLFISNTYPQNFKIFAKDFETYGLSNLKTYVVRDARVFFKQKFNWNHFDDAGSKLYVDAYEETDFQNNWYRLGFNVKAILKTNCNANENDQPIFIEFDYQKDVNYSEMSLQLSYKTKTDQYWERGFYSEFRWKTHGGIANIGIRQGKSGKLQMLDDNATKAILKLISANGELYGEPWANKDTLSKFLSIAKSQQAARKNKKNELSVAKSLAKPKQEEKIVTPVQYFTISNDKPVDICDANLSRLISKGSSN
jgi:hypothetical protein